MLGFSSNARYVQLYQRWSRGHKARGQGHKKIRGQGQPFREQTLSRPRTGMLKAKDQGHKRKRSQKKKGLHKNFSGDLQKERLPKNFSRAPQNFNNWKKSAVQFQGQGLDQRGQGQGLDLRGQGLQNVSSRTSSRTLPLSIIPKD